VASAQAGSAQMPQAGLAPLCVTVAGRAPAPSQLAPFLFLLLVAPGGCPRPRGPSCQTGGGERKMTTSCRRCRAPGGRHGDWGGFQPPARNGLLRGGGSRHKAAVERQLRTAEIRRSFTCPSCGAGRRQLAPGRVTCAPVPVQHPGGTGHPACQPCQGQTSPGINHLGWADQPMPPC